MAEFGETSFDKTLLAEPKMGKKTIWQKNKFGKK